MTFLLGNFPLVAAVVVGINAAIARRRVRRFVEATGSDEAGAIRYVWSAAGLVAAWFLALDAVGHLSGASSVMCFIPASHPRTTAAYLAWAIWIGPPLAVVFWSWFLGGAKIMARYSALYSRYFHPEVVYGPGWSRLFTLVILAACIYVPFIMRRAGGPLTCGMIAAMQSPAPSASAGHR